MVRQRSLEADKRTSRIAVICVVVGVHALAMLLLLGARGEIDGSRLAVPSHVAICLNISRKNARYQKSKPQLIQANPQRAAEAAEGWIHHRFRMNSRSTVLPTGNPYSPTLLKP